MAMQTLVLVPHTTHNDGATTGRGTKGMPSSSSSLAIEPLRDAYGRLARALGAPKPIRSLSDRSSTPSTMAGGGAYAKRNQKRARARAAVRDDCAAFVAICERALRPAAPWLRSKPVKAQSGVACAVAPPKSLLPPPSRTRCAAAALSLETPPPPPLSPHPRPPTPPHQPTQQNPSARRSC